MNAKRFLILLASVLASCLWRPAAAQQTPDPYVQLAEIEIDPAQLDAYKTAVKEHIETAIREEPGVLVLYAVSDKEASNRVKVFEIYRDTEAYKSHLETAHFKKCKATTEKMVTSLKLVRTTPIMLGAKAK